MIQDLDILKQIQEWDKEIYALREALAGLPHQLELAREEVERQRERFAKCEEDLRKLQLKQKEKEIELQTKEDNVKRYEAQLMQVKTNKEYSSLQAEIRSLKADNSILEEGLIELIDEVEMLEKKTREEDKELKVKEELFQREAKAVEERTKSIHVNVSELERQKNEKIKSVDLEIAALYEQVVRNKRGVALIQVHGETCPACQMQLRPQVLNELKLKEKIVICENCSRLLYE